MSALPHSLPSPYASPHETADAIPSSAWLEHVAEWVAAAHRPESGDLAHELRSIAGRMAPGARHRGLPPSPAWLTALADWVSVDPRPQAPEFARQLRQWRNGEIIWLDR